MAEMQLVDHHASLFSVASPSSTGTPQDLQDTLDPNSSLTGTALAFFFCRLVTPPRRLQTVTGFLEELLQFYLRTTEPGSILRLTTATVSLELFGIVQYSERARDLARWKYDRVLKKLSAIVSGEHHKTPIEELVLCVILCGFYEVSTVLLRRSYVAAQLQRYKPRSSPNIC